MQKPKPTTQQIKSAMRQPDKAVTEPTQVQPGSFATLISKLSVGECVSRAVEMDENTLLYELPARLTDTKDSLRNNTAPSVRQAKARTGNDYSIEIGDMRVPSGRTFVVAVVTRTA